MKSNSDIIAWALALSKLVAMGARIDLARDLESDFYDLVRDGSTTGTIWEADTLFSADGSLDKSKATEAFHALTDGLQGSMSLYTSGKAWEMFMELCVWAEWTNLAGGGDPNSPERVKARAMSAAALFRCSLFVAMARAAGVPPSLTAELNRLVIESAR